jgi:cytochrome c oxidase subunit 4
MEEMKLDEPMNKAVDEAVEHEEDRVVHEDDHHPGDGGDHEHGLTDFGYVKVALFLGVVTAAEVVMSYTIDFWGPIFLPLLLLLMAIKFFVVVLFFMHLRFDNRLFSVMFYMGLGLAVGVYIAALFTFKFFSP